MSLEDRFERGEAANTTEEYEASLELEELESLLEDLDEYEGTDPLPAGLLGELHALGFRDRTELRRRIAEMHSELDLG
jgi:hypothetical protein